ncbi:MAG: sensor histidine kinase, partial [Caldilineales bacterium]|nr:sensor histidine kinase [Caldilineales bacterium]
RSRSVDPMRIAGYVVLVAARVPGVWDLMSRPGPERWLGLGLLAAFALLHLAPDEMLWGVKAKRPHLYFVVMSALVVSLVLLPPRMPYFVVLFFLLSAEAMMRFPASVGYSWVAGFSALTVLPFLAVERSNPGTLLSAPLYIAGYFFFAAFATQTARAEQARAESQRLLAELQEANRALQDYARQSEALAVAEERNRLAREMHDTLGHRLTVASVQLQAAERLVRSDPERAAATVRTAREQVSQALAELRQTVAALRLPVEADLPLDSALRRLTTGFSEATGLQVQLEMDPQIASLPRAHQITVYRAAQEGLTNVQKHAHARTARLAVRCQGDEVHLLLEDDGVGPTAAEPTSVGFGLVGLRERAEHLGGSLTFGPANGRGSRLSLRLPLPAAAAGDLPVPEVQKEAAVGG